MPRRWSIAGTLMLGLFVAYLDRTNLSVGLPSIARDLGFAGKHFALISSWTLTSFLIGYALANILGGFLTRRFDPRSVVIAAFALWSIATIIAAFTHVVWVLISCRVILGVAEGIYWPQQSRFAKNWFAAAELTKANSIIQYYGQFIALAIGFMLLTPIYHAFGWRAMFCITGLLGLLVIVPLFWAMLRPQHEAPYPERQISAAPINLSWSSLGGASFLLLVFSYLTQGMLFWGITLWIPLVVRSLGFSGDAQALASASPYIAAVALAVPISIISDRTGKRVLIASLGLIVPGLLLFLLPAVESSGLKLGLIILAMGIYASSYTPNIWPILQTTTQPEAIGPAAGIMNGIGAGGGGTLAGFLVGMIYHSTGSYMPSFAALGGMVLLGGIALLVFGRLSAGWIASQRVQLTPPQMGLKN